MARTTVSAEFETTFPQVPGVVFAVSTRGYVDGGGSWDSPDRPECELIETTVLCGGAEEKFPSWVKIPLSALAYSIRDAVEAKAAEKLFERFEEKE